VGLFLKPHPISYWVLVETIIEIGSDPTQTWLVPADVSAGIITELTLWVDSA